MHDKIQEWLGAIVSGGSALAGWLVIANTYLQTIAFILSIAVAATTLWSWYEKRRDKNTPNKVQ